MKIALLKGGIVNSMNRFIHSLHTSARDLIFPPRCAVCSELLPPFDPMTVLCPECRAAWDEARASAAEAAAASAVGGHVFAVFYRSGKTDGVPERLIFHLKHEGDPRAFTMAASTLSLGVRISLAAAGIEPGDREGESSRSERPVIYTYPPRRKAAVRKDGFDQAERLARALSREMDGDFARLLCRTRRPSQEQKTLDAVSRTENAAVAYALVRDAAERVRGRAVVLCDDLSTTGATLDACADLLRVAGAVAVIKVTVGQTDQRPIPQKEEHPR